MNQRGPAQRSWLEVRLRQLRNPPPPVLRAVLANSVVAGLGGIALLAIDLFAPTADLPPLIVVYVIVVITAGSLLTYLWVDLPTGASGVRRRSAWAGVLGAFAAIPTAYLVLVLIFEVVKPLLR